MGVGGEKLEDQGWGLEDSFFLEGCCLVYQDGQEPTVKSVFFRSEENSTSR